MIFLNPKQFLNSLPNNQTKNLYLTQISNLEQSQSMEFCYFFLLFESNQTKLQRLISNSLKLIQKGTLIAKPTNKYQNQRLIYSLYQTQSTFNLTLPTYFNFLKTKFHTETEYKKIYTI